MLVWPNNDGPDLLVDDGGDATLLIHEGVKAEREFAKLGILPNPDSTDNHEFKLVLSVLKRGLEAGHTKRWTTIAERLIGVSEETTTGVFRLEQMSRQGTLLLRAINVNDCVTKSKFDNIYDCRLSIDSWDNCCGCVIVIPGEPRNVALRLLSRSCCCGDVGKGCAAAMKAQGARVVVTECDPICALQACMEGLDVKRLSSVVSTADIFVTATGNHKIIMASDMAQMKNNAIVCNIGHFDNEIDMAGLEKYPGIKKENIKDQVDRYEFPDGHGILVLASGRLVNLGCATGHPSFVMSCSFTNQVLA
jgi:adenosylhomocysteinase